MKDENFNENDSSLDEVHRREVVTLSSPFEEIQKEKEYLKFKRKESSKKRKKIFRLLIVLLFVVLGIYLFKLIKKGSSFKKKSEKTKDNINDKKLIEPEKRKLNNIKEDKTKKIEKKKKEELQIKNEKIKKDIKIIDKSLVKK